MEEKCINMKEPKEKLRTLKLPDDVGGLILDFGKYLADRLNDELVPVGFILGTDLALYDLAKGVDGFTRKPIQSRLVGYPPIIYSMIRMRLPEISDAIFPAEFSAEVKAILEE